LKKIIININNSRRYYEKATIINPINDLNRIGKL